MSKVEISEIKLKDNGTCPVLINFQTGVIRPKKERKLKNALFEDPDGEKIMIASYKKLLYKGIVKEDELKNNFLLIRNQRTGKVRIVEIETATLAPYMPQNERETFNTSISTEKSYLEINRQFGTKKTRRITEQRERMKSNMENVRELLEDTIANVEIDEADLLTAHSSTENNSGYRPPINRSATCKEDVYNIYDVVTKDVMKSLKEVLNAYNSNPDSFKLHPFINQQLTAVNNSELPHKGRVLKLLLYTNYLITYSNKTAKEISLKDFVICPESKDVNRFILENFSMPGKNGRTRPISMRDKTFCYILVLLMILLNYELNVMDLAKDLKLSLKKIQEICRVLAFSTSSKNRNVMVLKVPLPAPVIVTPKNKKRK